MRVQGSFVRVGSRCSGRTRPLPWHSLWLPLGTSRRFPERLRPRSRSSLGTPLGFHLALRVRAARAFRYAPRPHS